MTTNRQLENCTNPIYDSISVKDVKHCVTKHQHDLKEFKKCLLRFGVYYINLYCDASQMLVDGECIDRNSEIQIELPKLVSKIFFLTMERDSKHQQK